MIFERVPSSHGETTLYIRSPRMKSNDEGLEAFDVQGGVFQDIEIGEGEMFLLPGEIKIVRQCEL